ncbi:THUMP domain-containing protein 1 isoform X2 [Nerophis ophidion]|uniref:THUMP domain-containing protein 1 isoform X2 n=1 Tax=Nerophis ophidion TaxID=159077 RepID=UPI002AE0882B|nr:THUMP domain-containing protein 1 isoform X2 [Nerophis ophidion]
MQGEGRKRNKKHYVGQLHHKRWRGGRELEVGMQGILVTCNNNQKKCTSEAYDLLNEYADKLYGAETFPGAEGSCPDEDVDDALKREVEMLRAHPGYQERRFQTLESGANNVIFIRTHNLESDKLVHYILSDLHATKKKKTRLILRMLPVMGTCRAFMDDILKYLSNFLQPWFKRPNTATYQVVYKARNNNHSKREDVIKSVAGLVGKMNSKNRVNLTKPDLTIMLEVIKGVCCVSVAREYTVYKKYNLQEVVREDVPKTEEPAKAGDKAAAAGEGKEDDKAAGEGKEDDKAAGEGKDDKVEEMEGDKVEEKEGDKAVEEGKEDDKVEEMEGNKVEEKEGDKAAEEGKKDDKVEEMEGDTVKVSEEEKERKVLEDEGVEEQKMAGKGDVEEEEKTHDREDKGDGESSCFTLL